MTAPGPLRRPDEAAEYWFHEGCHILEIINEPADPDASVARARVPAGATTRWHRLAATTERYLILSGSGEAWVGDVGPLPVAPGDLVLIPPGVRQRVRAADREDLVFLAICTPRFRPENYSPA
jgi:mannose-6-phosphate isomerase-like protein (cupin superfamily)